MTTEEPTAVDAVRRALAERLSRDGGTASGLLPDQQRTWMLHELDHGAPGVVLGVYRLSGPLDQAALQQAVAGLGWRYELLRSSFQEFAGRPLRVVASYAELHCDLVEATGQEEPAALAERCAAELARPFDVARGPLARLTVVRIDAGTHLLLTALHETIADEWTPDILCRALLDGYRALLAGDDDAELTADDFTAVVQAERSWLDGDEAAASLAFWKEVLDGVPVLRLPTDRPRPAVKTHRCGTRRRTAPLDLAAALDRLGQRYGTDRDTVVLAAFQALLGRWAQQEDIAVGVRIPGPRRAFGPYANTVVIRTLLFPELTVGQLVDGVREIRKDVVPHGRMPFSRVVDAVDPIRDLSRTPLFQVLFTAREALEPVAVGDLTAAAEPAPADTTPYDLALTVLTGSGAQTLQLTYNEDLFDGGTAERMLDQLTAMLTRFASHPDGLVATVPLAGAAERDLITSDWNATEQAYPHDRGLHELVAEQAERTPSLVAVSDQEEELRYRDLDERANQLAHHLLELGVTAESRVALCLRRSAQIVVAMLAVLKAGAAYVPLDPQYPAERLGYLLSDSDSQVLITETALLDRLPAHQVRTMLMDAEWGEVADRPRTCPEVTVDPGSLAYLIYTSGSSGLPKGVLVTHGGIVNNLAWRQRTWPLKPGERVLQNHPFSFDPSVWATFWPLTVGAECVISAPSQQLDTGALVRLIRDREIVLYGAVPSVNAVLMEHPEIGECTSLRHLLSGAEPLTGRLQQAVHQRLSASVANLYGPTETTIDATYWQCARDRDPQAAPIGRPVDNLRVYLVDSDGQLVPPGVPGEICVAGVGLARGYHRRPGLTAERFVPDPFSAVPGGRLYRTGDLGRWRPDGAIEFLGRADQQVKVRGFRVELGEIESVITMSDQVRDAVVVARPDGENSSRLIAYVVPSDQAAPPTTAGLAEFVGDMLPSYMVPSLWVPLDTLPLTVNGKVDRRALPEPPSAPAVAAGRTAPRTPLETETAQAFGAVLGTEEIGVEDDFFELGGTSIMLARLASRLLAQYQLDIPVHQFFRVPTVAGVSSVVETYNRAGIEGVMSQQHATRLDEDARLDDDIDAGGLPAGRHLAPRTVLLTGATGYLGAFLLEQLLRETTASVYCLVRAADDAAAARRIEDSMRQYLIWDESYRERIKALTGDLALPRLGTSEESWRELAEQVDVIYHNGALVNFVYPYSALRGPNVRGTHEVLRLACTHQVKAVHYVSTIDVLLATHTPRPFLEDDGPLRNPVEVPGGYTGSKWVAEKMVHLARERGIPVSIYRPGLIMSHSETGATQNSDYLLVAFRGYLPMRILPDYPRIFDTVPVDYVAKAIVGISRKPEAVGRFFHLFNPAPVSIRRFCEWIQSYGYDFDIVPFEEARRRALEVDTSHPLYPLVPLIRDAEVAPQPSLDPAYIDQLQPDAECRNVLDALAGTGIACPPMTEEMAHACLEFLVQDGFLPSTETVEAKRTGSAV
ncbi:non-ribosomal peptide synthetase [Streptomyces sp. ISL-100]|uniref:non-ribosomal peptide synthetase n=1 Tax=Streptomyces sp. ISL-100 TaxID=2819173 RepID=UPI001BEA0900|nr:non-ribosomal peptide synthetase [Streptomyces sp. ISL-100]MBT2400793.1 amino acid adenylation domain-containing protein [Streptomyces sp. ISL-100]